MSNKSRIKTGDKIQKHTKKYWLNLELEDPLGLVGQTIPSTHCKGKTETIFAFDVPGKGGDPYGSFHTKCSCGWAIERQRFTRFKHSGSSPLPKAIKNQMVKFLDDFDAKNKNTKLGNYLSKAREWRGNLHRQFQNLYDFLAWGILIDEKVLSEIKPELLRKFKKELYISPDHAYSRRS